MCTKARFLMLLPVVLFATSLWAQDYRGRIQGTVLDSSKAAIPGASVTLTNQATRVITPQKTGDDGHYVFDLVEPGKYDVSFEKEGFQKLEQHDVLLQTRGDVTVDATLSPGAITQTVTVEAQATTVEFNTPKLDTTVDSVIVNRLPVLQRASYYYAQLLNPYVEADQQNTADDQPYSSWGPGDQRIAGGAAYSNDVSIDGSPSAVSMKNGYQPAPDMVDEANIVQNVIGASQGDGAGSAINLTIKSGTNQWHGVGFYQGQWPWANALDDRVYATPSLERKHLFGGDVGFPIKKNKLFNFVGYEGWKYTQPGDLINTIPTMAERQGDFSQSLNSDGTTRWLYDPFSTTATGQRMTFAAEAGHPGDPTYNKVPASVLNPIAAYYTSKLWQPNQVVNLTANPTMANNYAVALPILNPYKNFVDRVDYNVTDKLHLYGHVGLIRTPVTTVNPTGSALWQSDRGSQRNGTQIAGAGTYSISDKTLLTVRGDYYSLTDASKYANTAALPLWQTIWGSTVDPTPTTFYNALYTDPSVPRLEPRMSMVNYGGSDVLDLGAAGGMWNQFGSAYSFSGEVSHQHGKHLLAMGAELIPYSHFPSLEQNNNPGFGFDGSPTSSTYLNTDYLSGDPYATFLLGVLEAVPNISPNNWADGDTSMPVLTLQNTHEHELALYFNDSWKVTRDVTLTLGLRYEYESAYSAPANNLTLMPDLTVPNTVLQGTGVGSLIQSDVQTALTTSGYTGNMPLPPLLNGAFQYTSSGHPNQWDAGYGNLSPRLGIALRLNNKMSLRAGYGRYFTPWRMETVNGNTIWSEGTTGGLDMASNPFYGYTQVTGAPSTLSQAIPGTPPMSLSNPFPASFPIQLPTEKTDGVYTGLGDPSGIPFYNPKRPKSHSDKFDVTLQREIAPGAVLEVGYLVNFTTQLHDQAYNINQIDPRIAETPAGLAAELTTVPNPFYNLLPTNEFPGSNALLPTVSLASLMVRYPQYGPLTEYDAVRGGNMHYQALMLKLTKHYSHGLSILAGYSYHYESDQRFFNNTANYLQQWTWMQSPNSRHRITASGSYDLPFGKGRHFLASAPRGLDAVVGGWYLSMVGTWRSGNYLELPGALVSPGTPVIPNPSHNGWLNTSMFTVLPAGYDRENPWYYPGLTGPHFMDIDSSLVKKIPVTERTAFELRMDAFNTLNQLTWGLPDTSSPSSPTFGKSTDEMGTTFGRILQLGLRFTF